MNLVVRLSMPYNPVRVVLTVICAAALLLGIFVFPDFFFLEHFTFAMGAAALLLSLLVTALFQVLYELAKRNQKRYLESL